MADAKKPAQAATTKKTTKSAAPKATVKKVEVKDGNLQENSRVTDDANHQEAEVVENTTEVKAEETSVAKAGKRSAKALKETEEKEAKEARKVGRVESEEKEAKKPVVRKTRTRLERAGKKFRKASQLIEKDKEYSLKEALDLATRTGTTKFDSTVELHVRLNVDPRQADQNLRDNLVLPEGTGKSVRVAVFAEADDAATAKNAGADIAAGDELLKDLDKGKIDFDILVATPSQMAKLGKYARVLGPKGLMPNPKSGTVTTDVAKAVKEAKAGRVEYRVDSTGIVHLGIGKVSFGADKLENNTRAIFASLKSAKPASVKGTYVRTIHVSTTMGPSIKVLVSEL
jgi:large subunit ribosomal protein L1